MKNELIKELIVVLLSIDYQNTNHVCENYKWSENQLEIEFRVIGDDNMMYFCGRHFINEFNDQNIENMTGDGIDYKIVYMIQFHNIDSLLEDILDTIDNTKEACCAFDCSDYYNRIPYNLFCTHIKDIIMDAIYGEGVIHLESEVVRLLSKTTEFSLDGINSLIKYSKERQW